MIKNFLIVVLATVSLHACAKVTPQAEKAVSQDAEIVASQESKVADITATTTESQQTAATNESQQTAATYEIDCAAANDSAEISQWLKESEGVPAEQLPDFFGKKFLGRPYVGKTLEHTKTEKLVINTRQLDCTTFTENVMALTITRKLGKSTFKDFCEVLMNLRYEKPFGGQDNEPRVAYSHRNHYFTGWAISNIAQGYFQEITEPKSAFTGVQHVKVDFMTKNPQYYVMLDETPTTRDSIAAMEKRLSDPKCNTYPFFPKDKLKNTNTKEFRDAIHEGDIVIILTNKAGLDTQHITLAHWENDGLHIRHASSIRKKVVNEPLTLYQYLQNQKSATGVRILRLK